MHRIPVYDPGPIVDYSDPNTEFHCLFGLHEAMVYDDDGNSHCDACGQRIDYIEVED